MQTPGGKYLTAMLIVALLIIGLFSCQNVSAATTVTSVSPTTGAVTGGTAITITGQDFLAGATVTIGGNPATNVVVQSATEITAVTPPQAGNLYAADVVVTNTDMTTSTLSNGFTYESTSAGIYYSYYRLTNVTGPLPNFTLLQPDLNGVRSNATIPNGNNVFEVRNDNWAAQYEGYVDLPEAGNWTFFTASDDGSRLFLDGTMVVDNNFFQGVQERSGVVNNLQKGKHRIVVQFAQGGGGFGLFVRWQGPTTAKADIPDSAFCTDPVPSVAIVLPVSGPSNAATPVTIYGANFETGATVTFGSVAATGVTVVDSNTITAVAPSGLSGIVAVKVTSADGKYGQLANAYTYTANTPTITNISPDSGFTSGGDTVTITGTNFYFGATVRFDAVSATNVTVVNSTTIQATVPPGVIGDVDVTVTNTDTKSVTLADGFSYIARPADTTGTLQSGIQYKFYHVNNSGTLPDFSTLTPVTSGIITTDPVFDLSQRDVSDNTAFVYTGYITVANEEVFTFYTDSNDGARLYIGNTLVVDGNFAQNQGAEESGSITLAAGAHAIRIEYANFNGASGLTVRYSSPTIIKTDIPVSVLSCIAPPTVTAVNPTSGSSLGGDTVTITGTGFVSGATVGFGGKAATSVTFVDSTTLTCVTPALSAASVSVVVTNPDGSSGSLVDGTVTLFDGFAATVAGLRNPEFALGELTQNAMAYKYYEINTGSAIPNNPTIGNPNAYSDPNAMEPYTVVKSGTLLKDQFTPNFITTGPTNADQSTNGNMISPRLRNDNIVFRHNAYVRAATDGVYTFRTSSDDGSLLFIGNTLVVNNNQPQGITDRTGTIGLKAGLHRMTVLFTQGGGGYGLSIGFQRPADGSISFIPDDDIFLDVPTISSISPAQIATDVTGSVTITGTGFSPGATVKFGNTAATNVVVVNSTTITATAPVNAVAGPVSVTIVNESGGQSTTPNAFHYSGPAVSLSLNATGGVAGAATLVTVTALDSFGKPAVAYTGTVEITSTDGNAVLPADYTFIPADNGVHTLSVVLKTGGSQTITATDSADAGLTGSTSITVTPAATGAFTVTAPASVTAGSAFSVTVTAVDAFGNVTPSYTGTIAFGSSDLNATLPANYTFVAGDNGVHTFASGVTLTVGPSKTVTVNDGTNTGSTSVNINAAAVSGIVVTGFASPSVAGAGGTNITVSAVDAFGNVNTGYTGSISFTSTDPQAVLPANFTFGAGDSGSKSFSVSLATAGSQSITVTDTNTPAFTDTITSTITPDIADSLIVSGYTVPAGAGTSDTFTITAIDRFGNAATDYTGTINLTSNDATATFASSSYTFVLADNGVHTLSATFNTVGTFTLTATDANDATITGSQTGIAVQATASQTITFGTLNDQVFGVQPITVSATADSNLPVTFSVTGPATISGNQVTLNGVGTVTVIASQAGNANYSPAPDVAQSFDVTQGPQTITFDTIDDQSFGNPVNVSATASSGLPVAFSIVSGPATISGTTITLTGLGTVVVNATQAGDANYLAATPVQESFDVINVAPGIVSGAQAVPNPATVASVVTFSVAASDPENATLTYAWNFGDGTNGTGSTTTHTYGALGTFPVTVTVTDPSGGFVTSTVSVVVNGAGSAGIPITDSDGDGFSDDIEVAAGSNPLSATDSPFGGATAGTPLTLPDVKAGFKLSFAKANSDSLKLSGTLLVKQGVTLGGQKVVFDIGGITRSFTLDAKGSAKSGADAFKVSSKGTSARTAKFALKISKAALAAKLTDEGMTSDAAKNKAVQVGITILFNNTMFQKLHPQSYSAKAGVGGSSKDVK